MLGFLDLPGRGDDGPQPGEGWGVCGSDGELVVLGRIGPDGEEIRYPLPEGWPPPGPPSLLTLFTRALLRRRRSRDAWVLGVYLPLWLVGLYFLAVPAVRVPPAGFRSRPRRRRRPLCAAALLAAITSWSHAGRSPRVDFAPEALVISP